MRAGSENAARWSISDPASGTVAKMTVIMAHNVARGLLPIFYYRFFLAKGVDDIFKVQLFGVYEQGTAV
jgi:hypothetical protein